MTPSTVFDFSVGSVADDNHDAGLPQAAPGKPLAHQDAYIRLTGRSARGTGLMDRSRPKQTRPLPQRSRAQDGHLRRLHQRTLGTRPDQHPTEALQRQD